MMQPNSYSAHTVTVSENFASYIKSVYMNEITGEEGILRNALQFISVA